MFRLLRWDQKIPTCSAGFMKGWQRSPATLRDFLALFVKRLSGEHDAMCPMCQRGHLYQLQLAAPHPNLPPHPSRSATAWKQVTFGSGCDLRIRTVARSNVPSSNKLTNGWWDGYLPRSIQTGTRTDARVPLHTRRCHVSGRQMEEDFFFSSFRSFSSFLTSPARPSRSLLTLAETDGAAPRSHAPCVANQKNKKPSTSITAAAAGEAPEHPQWWSRSSLKLEARGEAYDVDCAGRKQTHGGRFHAFLPFNRTIRGCTPRFAVAENAKQRKKKRALEHSWVTSTTNPIVEAVTVRHVHCFPFSRPAANTKMRSCEQKNKQKKKQNFANVWLLCKLCSQPAVIRQCNFVRRTCRQASPSIKRCDVRCDSEAWWGSHLGPLPPCRLEKFAATVCRAIRASSTSEPQCSPSTQSYHVFAMKKGSNLALSQRPFPFG